VRPQDILDTDPIDDNIEAFARWLHRAVCLRGRCDISHIDLYWNGVDQSRYRRMAKIQIANKSKNWREWQVSITSVHQTS
jgi:hypothetical protein